VPRLSFEEGENGALIANLDISETDDAIEVVVDVPGIEEKDIDVTLSDGALLIQGKRESEKEEKEKNYHRIERSYGEFQRRIGLPCDVEADKVDARLEKGILTVTLPKSEESKKADRKIKIEP
jgi:HSP20 family protein